MSCDEDEVTERLENEQTPTGFESANLGSSGEYDNHIKKSESKFFTTAILPSLLSLESVPFKSGL